MSTKLLFRKRFIVTTLSLMGFLFWVYILHPLKWNPAQHRDVNKLYKNFKYHSQPGSRLMKVHKYLNNEWIIDGNICRNTAEVFITGILLNGPQGTLPIYVHSPLADQFVSGGIIREGAWESDYVSLIHAYLLNDTSLDFVDIGANIGVYTLTMSKLGRQVIAIEPFKPNIQRLCRTLEDNRVDNHVTLVTNPLSDNRTTVVMHEQFGNIGGTHAQKTDGNVPGTLNTITLDDVYNLKPLKRVVIKMDVESYENKVLQGGKEFFDKVDVRIILMEWVQHKQSKDARAIISFLTERNLYPYTVEQVPLPLELHYFAGWPNDVLWINKNPLMTWDKKLNE
ncbi:uncharacterized protein LOC126828295 [Patella vulgata]|uniref:uncharacterized protein LOC126828295 n=1 Tax=Patella vulgata TaxID=6465 RepID=UPI0021806836|nr:uncharacterized protein LOC126828295 [Patella vulgata]